jgi:hypothetical protein
MVFWLILRRLRKSFVFKYLLNIILKKKLLVHVTPTLAGGQPSRAHVEPSSHQTLPFIVALKRSRRPLRDEAMCAPNTALVWHQWPFLFFFFFFLNIWSLSFLLLFLFFLIIYKIRLFFFNFTPLLFFLSFKFGLYFYDCYLFYLGSFLKLAFFTILFSLSLFFLLNLILILLIYFFFTI